jgi:hypothetical protein
MRSIFLLLGGLLLWLVLEAASAPVVRKPDTIPDFPIALVR